MVDATDRAIKFFQESTLTLSPMKTAFVPLEPGV
jgi:hypothetical protein